MTQKPKYFIIEASLLPEVFLKTAEANRLLKNGELYDQQLKGHAPKGQEEPSPGQTECYERHPGF